MTGPGYVVPPDVAYVTEDGAPGPIAYLVRVPDGRPMVLQGTAALIWCTALAVPAGDIIAEVIRASDGSEAEVASGVRRFLDDLVSRDLLRVGEPENGQDAG